MVDECHINLLKPLSGYLGVLLLTLDRFFMRKSHVMRSERKETNPTIVVHKRCLLDKLLLPWSEVRHTPDKPALATEIRHIIHAD